jgi:CDP-glucose 4,6-dehydratase
MATDKAHAHEAFYLKVDASKARARLDWDNRLPLDDALAWTAEWYQAQLRGREPKELMAAQIERYEALGSRAI